MGTRLIDSLIGYIGNPKFCTIDEAIEHALSYGSTSYYEMVMSRADMTLGKAINFADTVNKAKVWRILVSRLDLDVQSAESYANSSGDPRVWISFFERDDFPLFKAFEKAQKIGRFDILCAVLARKDATPEIVVEYALFKWDSLFWEAALSKRDILMYLESLETEKLIKIARSSKSSHLWVFIIENRIENASDILAYAKDANKEEVYRIANMNSNVIEYLKKLPGDEALQNAVDIEHVGLRYVVLNRTDIRPAKLLFVLSRVKDSGISNWIMKRKDVSNYISNLSLKRAFELSELIGYKNSCDSNILKEKIEAYLMTVSIRKALSLAKSMKENKLQAFVLSTYRIDIPIKSVVKRAQEINDELVWAAVVYRPDFVEYFDKMSDKRALQFAEKCNNVRVWARLLSWRNLPLETIVSNVRRLNSESVWSVVKLREDVVEYLKS